MVGDYMNVVLQTATMIDCFRLAGLAPPTNLKKNIKCPLHDDSTPSFHIQESGKGWKCFGCGEGGGMLDFLVRMGTAPTNRDALFMLGDFHHIPREVPAAQPYRRPRTTLPPPLPSPEPEQPPTLEEREKVHRALRGTETLLSPASAPGWDYLRSRGLDPARARESRVRYHTRWGRREGWDGLPAVVFEVIDRHGCLVALQGRFLDPPAQCPKAMSLGPIGLGVYATDGALESRVVAVVEGPMDALALSQNGLPAMALMGKESKSWLRRHLKYRRVIIATDDDEAGIHAAEALRHELSFSTTVRFAFLDGCKDANKYLTDAPAKFKEYVQTLCRIDEPDNTPQADRRPRVSAEEIDVIASFLGLSDDLS